MSNMITEIQSANIIKNLKNNKSKAEYLGLRALKVTLHIRITLVLQHKHISMVIAPHHPVWVF